MQNTFRLSKWKRKATENENIFYCLLSIMDIDVGDDLNRIDRKQKPRREVAKPSVGYNHKRKIEKKIQSESVVYEN